MPLYEYQCQKCEKVVEVLVRSYKDTEGLCCPSCKGKKLNKMFSTFRTNSDQKIYTSAAPSVSSKSGCSSCASGSCSSCG